MAIANVFQPTLLRRTTSRTRTARQPLTTVSASLVRGSEPFAELYAGPVDEHHFPPIASPLESHGVPCPFEDVAVQVFGFIDVPNADRVKTGSLDPWIEVLLDLGQNYDIARVELYGNLALPPDEECGRPMHNFGLPRALGVAVREEIHYFQDLHRFHEARLWLTARAELFHQRFEARDFRGRWGWSSIALPPTYGRHLLLRFADLPLIACGKTSLRRGVDIQRIVVFPFLEGADHECVIECVPVASTQTAYTSPVVPGSSFYWHVQGVNPPDPARHQSVFLRSSDQRLLLPAALARMSVTTNDGTSYDAYSSDFVAIDSDERVLLTVEATTDEVPLVEGIRLFRSLGDEDWDQLLDLMVQYEITVHATTDPGAVWPLDRQTEWRTVRRAERVTFDAGGFAHLMFDKPAWARYFRLEVRLLSVSQTPTRLTHGRFQLSGLQLLRPRDFWLEPEPGFDYQLDLVLLRLRGSALTDDYAYFDGASGIGLTLEARTGESAFQTLKTVRSLLDLIENNQTRVFANNRYADKPVMRTVEQIDSDQSGTQHTESTGKTTTETSLVPETTNVTVTKAGTYTTHVENAGEELGAQRRAEFRHDDVSGVKSKRRYVDPVQSVIDNVPLDNPLEILTNLPQVLTDLSNSGAPTSVGVSFSGSLGVSSGLSGNASASLSLGGQLGGGITTTTTSGDQASVGETQSMTLYLETHQISDATSTQDQSRSGMSSECREVVRTDLSEERRRSGVSVQYGQLSEDILLVTWPVQRRLTWRTREVAEGLPRLAPDVVRVRVDHLPPGVTLDVEFRGTMIPMPGA